MLHTWYIAGSELANDCSVVVTAVEMILKILITGILVAEASPYK